MIIITGIEPKVNTGEDVSKHLAIKNFKWVNEQTSKSGISSLAIMFDWIVNKKGSAFVRNASGTFPVFGAYSPSGQPYLRSLNDGAWSNDLLGVDLISRQ